jgi:hypothetical protein
MDISALGRQAALFESASQGAQSRQIATAAQAIWFDIDSTLVPIIGARGVGALYKRAVNLASTEYPWLQTAYDHEDKQGHFVVLGTTLSRQSPPLAATANGALLQTFYDLLANLIGGPFTTRLLQSALDNLSTGDDAVGQ